ncbi:putative N-terminal domain of oxidoreductase [Lyophyllum shimeji]|uniref:N-terminal domain of oxidoreductase n=1 Tax=Lyophyllum shimeji TaxID=47721 RepID=A0A9P3PLZ5_LYOSH|nr:putative N-terminal domain of oxidoreductase [Lyophyllum shimeji]
MAPIRNARVVFNEIPRTYPEPGKTTVYDDKPTIDIENLKTDGGFVLKTLFLSIDPYLRGRMRPPEIPSYVPAFKIGEPLESHGVGVVVRSDNQGLKVGDHLYGMLTHEEYTIHRSFDGFRLLVNEERLPWSVYLGAAGMPGKTAYAGWREYSRCQRGQTVFVTAGAGPVGSMVIQLARLSGLKIIACAGSEEKVEFIRSLGADVVFNYKTTSTQEVLNKEGPLDIYWDNVGGEALDAALSVSAVGARFIECGMISTYNEGPKPVHNLMQVISNNLCMHGFIVFRLERQYDNDFYWNVPQMLGRGELKYSEEVWRGLEKVGDAILANQKGMNRAKLVIKVADE